MLVKVMLRSADRIRTLIAEVTEVALGQRPDGESLLELHLSNGATRQIQLGLGDTAILLDDDGKLIEKLV